MNTELLSLSQALLASRLRATSGTDEALPSKCQAVEKERDELKSSVGEFERQLASAKRELQSLAIKCLIWNEDTCVPKRIPLTYSKGEKRNY